MANAAANSVAIATNRSRVLVLTRRNPNLPCRGQYHCAPLQNARHVSGLRLPVMKVTVPPGHVSCDAAPPRA